MNHVLLLAAGASTRASCDKIWFPVLSEPLWWWSFQTFLLHPHIDTLTVVARQEDITRLEAFLKARGPLKKPVYVLAGGKSRMASFKCGFKALSAKEEDIVIEHNAANPWVSSQEISEVIQKAQKEGAASVSIPLIDTLISQEKGHYKTLYPREGLRLMQTPQASQVALLKRFELSEEATDLSSALLPHHPVALVEASPLNRKITYPEDLRSLGMASFIGEDSHRFGTEGVLQLGGLALPDYPALLGNSDADVVLHAIGRALASACQEEFSEKADALLESGEKNSTAYLQPFLKKIIVERLSLQIEAKVPRLQGLPLADKLSEILEIPVERISINAMTGEELTPFGRGEAIRCTCLLTARPR